MPGIIFRSKSRVRHKIVGTQFTTFWLNLNENTNIFFIFRLQSRLSESEKAGSKICGPATFPKSQDFFKTFIVVSQK